MCEENAQKCKTTFRQGKNFLDEIGNNYISFVLRFPTKKKNFYTNTYVYKPTLSVQIRCLTESDCYKIYFIEKPN